MTRANGRDSVFGFKRVVPKDPAWLAQKAVADEAIRRECERLKDIEEHLGGQAVERKAEEAARRYSRKAFMQEHAAALEALKRRDAGGK